MLFKLKICTVPLSLLHASHFEFMSNAREYIVAYSLPLLSYWIHYVVRMLKILIIVPFYEAVANFRPFGHNYKAYTVDLWAYMRLFYSCSMQISTVPIFLVGYARISV